VNAAAVDTYADVSVWGLGGEPIASRRVSFSPQSQRRVELGTLLRSSGSSATTGSILVMPRSDSGGAIAAALSMTYRTNPEPNYIDEELAMPSMSDSQVLRAVADSGEGSPLVALTSLAESVQEVQIDCLGKDGAKSSKVVELAAGETLLTEACEQQTTHGTDFANIWTGAKDAPRGPVGIALRSDAMPGSFAAFALSPHAREQERFFSSVPFSDPKMLMSGTTVFAGVPVGRAAFLPQGNYMPQLSLSNFSGKDSTVRVRYSETSGDSPKVRDLDSVVVPAMSSKEILLENIEGDGELMNSFLAISDAIPGDVMAKLVAKGDSQLREVELLGKDGLEQENAGIHPWSLEHGTESILVLFNHGIGPQYFTVLVSADRVVWRKAYLLKPMQTKAINIRDLVEKRLRDEKGKVLPRNAVRGEVGWVSAGKGIGKGRILQSNPSTAMARSFSCGSVTNPNSPATVTLTPTSPIALGASTSAHLQVGFFTTLPNQYGCGGNFVGYDLTGFSVNWTGNSNIVSIPPSNAYDVTVTGTAPGSGAVQANINGPTCGTGAGASITVNGPDHLSVVIDNEGFAQCPQNQEALYLRQVQMQVVDTNNHALGKDVYIQETQSPAQPQNSCPNGGSPVPASCALTGTTGVGQFLDNMSVNRALCVAQGSVPAGCGFSVTSTWSACSTSGSNTLWVSPRVTHSDSVTLDGRLPKWPGNTQCNSTGCH
jgi:hypothetical protein